MLAANLERVVVGSSANRVEKGTLCTKVWRQVTFMVSLLQFIDTECMSTH